MSLNLPAALAFAVCYFAVALLVAPTKEAGLIAALAGAVLFGLSVLTRSNSPIQAFRWFREHRLRGLFVVALTCTFPIIGVLNQIAWPSVLIELPLVFLWFWFFAAIATYAREPKA